MLRRLKAILPRALEPISIQAWFLLRPLLRVVFFGRKRYCPVCESQCRFFLSHGPAVRQQPNNVCANCLSHDRHRLAWTYCNRSTNLNDGSPKVMLHFAPESELERKFRSIPGVRYLSADVSSPHAMHRIDITDIDWPDASFDIIYCSHVLEHVPDDRRAMSEMFRVLRPGGWVLIQVPFSKTQSLEDLSVTDPAERERLFWQSDHVRLYGPDITDRLVAAGFAVNVVFPHEYLQPEDRERMRIRSEPLFLCHKLAAFASRW